MVHWRGARRIGRVRWAERRQFAKRNEGVVLWNQEGVSALYANHTLIHVDQAGLHDKRCWGKRLKQQASMRS